MLFWDNYIKKFSELLDEEVHCPSLVNVGLSFSFSNFAVSLIISKMFLKWSCNPG